jgi:hypothetical protein
MSRYLVTMRAMAPVPSADVLEPSHAVAARRVIEAPCARLAACDIARPYVDAGLVVDWSARRAGLRRVGRRWSGRFTPNDGDDGLAGVREPRRPHPPAPGLAATAT